MNDNQSTRKEKVWLYSGSFDPFTVGHQNIAKRASDLCDKLIIAVFEKTNSAFSTDEKIRMILLAMSGYANIEVISFQGLLADVCKKYKVTAIVRGIRNSLDLDYESPMAEINHALNDSLETVFLLARNQYAHVSSTNARELGKYSDNLLGMIPQENHDFVLERLKQLR